MSEIAKKTEFDPKALAEQLRDKIRVDMAELMPDDMWQSMLEKEMATFFEEQPEVRSPHGHVTKSKRPSILHELVTSIMKEEASKRIKAELEKPEWHGLFHEHTVAAGPRVEEFIRANAGEIFASVIGAAIQSAVDQVKMNLQTNPTY